MRWFILVTFLCGCTRAAPPAAVPEVQVAPAAVVPPALAAWTWSTLAVTSGVLAEVRQESSQKGRCVVTAAVGSQKVWSTAKCLAMKDDLRFVSPDATTLIVLKSRPETENSDFAVVYRKGDRTAALSAGALHLPASAVRDDAGALTWLAPREAREMATGVEVELLDGTLLVVGFDGTSKVTPAALSSAAIPAGAEACAPCSYTDKDGVYHFVETAGDVPLQYRGAAHKVRGSVLREGNVVIIKK